MTTQAKSTFQVTAWEERPFDEMTNGPSMTRATVTKTFRGDIQGESSLEYLMTHVTENQSSFVGIERVVGTVGGRMGTFVLQHAGTFVDGKANDQWTVVPGSGTGDLKGLRGQGGFESAHADEYPFRFEYDFE